MIDLSLWLEYFIIILVILINNVLIPFLDKLEWFSKKNLDSKDWKLVLTLKQKGWHLSDQGKEVI